MALKVTCKKPYNITEFPSELLEHIFKFCSWQDLPAIVLSCKTFHKHREQIISNLTKESLQRLSLLFLPDNSLEIDSLCQRMKQISLIKPISPSHSLKILIAKVAEKKLQLLDSKEASILFLKDFEEAIKKNGIPFSFAHRTLRGGNLHHIQKTLEVFSYHSAFCLIRNLKKSGESDQTLLYYLCDKYLKRYKVYKTPSDIEAATNLASLISGNPQVKKLLSEKIKLLKDEPSPQ
jgi:hypothetical protein